MNHLRPPMPFASLLLALGLAAAAPASAKPARYLGKPDTWFAGPDAPRIATNILSHQSDLGGWPKNTDTDARPFTGNVRQLRPTFDNGATTDELRFLARMVAATRKPHYQAPFERGLDYILNAQYPTGGWPQSHPPGNDYHRHITFNDGTMVRLLDFLRETWTRPTYDFLDPHRKQAARAAFDRGIQCILKCQVVVDDQPTAWCAQHDEIDYQPRPGRSYELVSLSGSESVGILRLLMSLEKPGPEIVRAVDAAVGWFRAARLDGIRVIDQPAPNLPKGKDKVVVADPFAEPLWARFYEIATNRPLFVDRDGIPRSRLADIGYERRNGYAWYGSWPKTLIDREYPKWKNSRHGFHRSSDPDSAP